MVVFSGTFDIVHDIKGDTYGVSLKTLDITFIMSPMLMVLSINTAHATM